MASKSEDRRRSNVDLPEEKPSSDEITFYEYWGVVPGAIARATGIEGVLPDDEEVECIISVDHKFAHIMRAELNTYPGQQRMFISDVWEPSGDKSLYGRGIPENVRGPQMALNATVNTRLDNKTWAMAKPLIVNPDLLEDEDDLIAKPNWVIRVTGKPDDVAKFVDIPDVTAGASQEAAEFERYIDDESGINKMVQASQSFGQNRTFGGISLAFSAASRPVRLIARGFELNLISDGLKKIYMMFMVNLDEQILIRVLDDPRAPEFVRVDPLSLSLDIDFIPRGTFAMASREAVVDGLSQFIQGIGQNPMLSQ
jgi:hypothetical protein